MQSKRTVKHLDRSSAAAVAAMRGEGGGTPTGTITEAAAEEEEEEEEEDEEEEGRSGIITSGRARAMASIRRSAASLRRRGYVGARPPFTRRFRSRGWTEVAWKAFATSKVSDAEESSSSSLSTPKLPSLLPSLW